MGGGGASFDGLCLNLHPTTPFIFVCFFISHEVLREYHLSAFSPPISLFFSLHPFIVLFLHRFLFFHLFVFTFVHMMDIGFFSFLATSYFCCQFLFDTSFSQSKLDEKFKERHEILNARLLDNDKSHFVLNLEVLGCFVAEL